ncbi:hypothetical protein ACFSCX_24005 [Bacillus salitolerans]|uniref:DUF4237 domain-containing protein n=1 Tax=Bacillus salitolerans TaxID=1437434 RepID=A0ABW4LWI4_9BACI
MHGIAEELWSSVKESFALIHSFDDMIYQTAKLTSSIVSGEITIQDIQDGLKESLKEEFVEPFEYIKKHGKDLDSATYKESKEFGHHLTKAIFTIGAVLTAGVGSAALLAKLGTKLGGTLKDIADIGSEKVLDDIGKGIANNIKSIGKDIKHVSANDVNAKYPDGYEPPYKSGTFVAEFTTTTDIRFVRVHGSNNRERSWVMKMEEIEGLTPEQIKEKFALPETPHYITDVYIPKGTRMRVGIAGENKFGPGGGIQYELLQRLDDPSIWQNTRKLSD